MNQRDALMNYLQSKLDSIPPRDATQKTVLATWLTELFLHKLNRLYNAKLLDQHEILRDSFKNFLQQNKEFLDRETTFNLIQSNGRVDEMLFFSYLVEDNETVIEKFIQRHDYSKALVVLEKCANQPNLFYAYSPILIEHLPKATVDLWIQISKQTKGTTASTALDPRRLIPALLRYNQEGDEHHGMRYLEFCVRELHNSDPALHNYLISLYAAEGAKDEGRTKVLHDYIRSPIAHYDKEYALRLCMQQDRKRACVHIYSMMGLFEEAVDLALTVDLELAQRNADLPSDSELRKRLWLRIVLYVVEKDHDVKKAMQFMNHCKLLKLEDIIPVFPDFVLIDDFKDEIAQSLEDKNRSIRALKNDMKKADTAASMTRKDIANLRNRFAQVPVNQKCAACDSNVLTRRFYFFPCHHALHTDCLIREWLVHATPQQRQELSALYQREKILTAQVQALSNGRDASALREQHEKIRNAIDEHVSNDCIYCGQIMIRGISQDLITADDLPGNSWSL
eukprot:TRINITY_DN6253_c0_g2_i1.p1 TRINITY_DN6253_c0_g2~~TRINITY_DN6253_c0_g2_i1.p1  ORF type:complete len:521 (+),score=75.96 TRINITY_DN6253_c0_g2_i1:37-1563(+)